MAIVFKRVTNEDLKVGSLVRFVYTGSISSYRHDNIYKVTKVILKDGFVNSVDAGKGLMSINNFRIVPKDEKTITIGDPVVVLYDKVKDEIIPEGIMAGVVIQISVISGKNTYGVQGFNGSSLEWYLLEHIKLISEQELYSSMSASEIDFANNVTHNVYNNASKSVLDSMLTVLNSKVQIYQNKLADLTNKITLARNLYHSDATNVSKEKAKTNNIMVSAMLGILKHKYSSIDMFSSDGVSGYTKDIEIIHNGTKYIMGSYKVSVDSRRIYVIHTHSNQILNDLYIHPHIKHNSICWGTYQNAISNAFGKDDRLMCLYIVHDFLSSYHRSGAYKYIEEWFMRDHNLVTCLYCGSTIANCSCSRSIKCSTCGKKIYSLRSGCTCNLFRCPINSTIIFDPSKNNKNEFFAMCKNSYCSYLTYNKKSRSIKTLNGGCKHIDAPQELRPTKEMLEANERGNSNQVDLRGSTLNITNDDILSNNINTIIDYPR